MEVKELREYMFPSGKGIAEVARALKIPRQNVDRWFDVQKVTDKNLRKYAQAKGLNEEEFIKIARGPAPQKNTDEVNEPSGGYENSQNGRKGSNSKALDDKMIGMVMGLIDNQKEQNEALKKLANAAEINAITIARLTGKE